MENGWELLCFPVLYNLSNKSLNDGIISIWNGGEQKWKVIPVAVNAALRVRALRAPTGKSIVKTVTRKNSGNGRGNNILRRLITLALCLFFWNQSNWKNIIILTWCLFADHKSYSRECPRQTQSTTRLETCSAGGVFSFLSSSFYPLMRVITSQYLIGSWVYIEQPSRDAYRISALLCAWESRALSA